MSERWGHQTVWLTTTDGTMPVEADTYGPWAVHTVPQPLLNAFAWGWTVTHAPTGIALAHQIRTKKTARAIAREAHKIVGETPITGYRVPRALREPLLAMIARLKDVDYPSEPPVLGASVPPERRPAGA